MVNWKYIAIAAVALGLLILAVVMYRRKSISFDFDLGGNFQNLLGVLTSRYTTDPNTRGGIGAYLDVPLTTFIKNKGAAATTLQNILGSISYDGEAILQTKADSTVLQNVTVPGKSSTPVTDYVQLLINPSSIKFLSELVKGKKPLVKYNFASTIFGKPYQFSNTSTINKPQL